jgi:hypothetical protein
VASETHSSLGVESSGAAGISTVVVSAAGAGGAASSAAALADTAATGEPQQLEEPEQQEWVPWERHAKVRSNDRRGGGVCELSGARVDSSHRPQQLVPSRPCVSDSHTTMNS